MAGRVNVVSKYANRGTRLRGALWRGVLTSQTTTPTKLDQLRKWQHLTPAEAKRLQRSRLRELLEYAYEHVPFYRQQFDQLGVKGENGEELLSEFKSLPILEKSMLRNHSEDLQSEVLSEYNWHYKSTGGSTGSPTKFIQDEEYDDWARAVTMLFDDWTGYTVGEPKVLLWGSERDLFEGGEGLATKVKRYLKNEHWLNAFKLEDKDLHQYVNQINTIQPTQILAYADSIYEFAKFVDREEAAIHSPDAIMTSAETLHPHMRETIEEVFSAPVFDRYGSREMGDIACECEHHEGYHVSLPTHYVEVVDESGSPVPEGEPGDLVVTSLTNRSMPLLRYRIGDVVVQTEQECECGRGWPLIQEVSGRITDMFVRSDDSVVSAHYFSYLLGVGVESDWIRKYRVVQNDYDQITVHIEPQSDNINPRKRHSEVLDEIEKKIKHTMGEECVIEFEFEEELEPADSGKFRYTVSHVHE